MLYLISGTLGDYDDISPNMMSALEKCDVLFVEKKDLFYKFIRENDIDVEAEIFDLQEQNNHLFPLIGQCVNEGKIMGLFEASGTPCFKDPGSDIVREIYEKYPKVKLRYIPGGSAITAALALCSFDTFEGFSYMGVVGEETVKQVKNNVHPYIYFFSHRLFSEWLTFLSFLETEKHNVFIGINIAKKVEYSNMILQGTGEEVFERFIKICNFLKDKGTTPDVIIVFDAKTIN